MAHVSSYLSVPLAWYLQLPQASFIHHPFPKGILLPDVLLSLKTVCAQSCPTLCDPMDCSLPGSSDRGIFQARILEWVAIDIYIFFFRFFSIIGYYEVLHIVHCAILKVFISFIYNSVYLLSPNS